MQSALLDTGALVAIVNRRDRSHARIAALLREFRGTFITTWPVIAEACSFMPERMQVRVLDWVAIASVQIVPIDAGLDAMRETMRKYADLPCDFADASLVYAAAETGVREIWSLDRDFHVFRLPDRTSFKLISGGK